MSLCQTGPPAFAASDQSWSFTATVAVPLVPGEGDLQDKQQAASEAFASPCALQEFQLCEAPLYLFDLSAVKDGRRSSACSTCMGDPCCLRACRNIIKAEGETVCAQDCQEWIFSMKTLVRLQH